MRGTFLKVPMIRTIVTIVYWGLYWGPLTSGNCRSSVVVRNIVDVASARECLPHVVRLVADFTPILMVSLYSMIFQSVPEI